jgi:hypothetical protein
MIIRFLKPNNALAFFLLPLIVVLLWGFAFFIPHPLTVKHTMPLYELLITPIASIHWLTSLIAMIIIVIEGFLFNYIVNENEVLIKKTNLPALFYIVFMSNNSSMLELHPILFANLFLLFALSKILHSYRKDIAFSQVFDAGLLISVATLFYFPCIIFFPLIGIALIIFRPFFWREWIISFIGTLVPYVFAITYYFWNGTLDYLLYDKMLYPIIFKTTTVENYPGSFYFLLSVGCLIVLLSFGSLFKGLEGGSQKTKKALILMIWYLAFAGLSVFLAPQLTTRFYALLAIPLAVICSNYYLRMKKELLGELLFLTFLAAVFVNLVVNIF